MKKPTFAILLAAMLCLCAFVSSACSGGEADKSEAPSATEQSEGGEGQKFLNEQKNWGGETVTVLTHKMHPFSYAAFAESTSGEPVNDAFYERNARIEELYGIKLQTVIADSPWDELDRARSDIDSGLDELQIYSLPLTYMAPLALEGQLYDYYSITNGYIHLDKEWWDQSVNRDLTINGKLWCLAGDALVEDDEATWAVYFNKDIIESRGLENPYELVNEKKWTVDKMHEMAKAAVHMDGDAMEFDHTEKDVWGLLVQSYDCYAFMLGAGQKMVENNGSELSLRVMEEENESTFSNIMDMVLDEQCTAVADFFGRWDSGVYDEEYRVFASGDALFMPYNIHTVSNAEMRDAQIHYGILPMPMRSETQDEYTTSVTCYWCEVLAIPVSNLKKLDVTCYALEAMAYYGKELVTPEYYARTLKYKRFEDDESGEMLDLIFRNRVYDLAGIFNFGSETGNGMLGFYTNLLGSRMTELASYWESMEAHFQGSIDEFMEGLKE